VRILRERPLLGKLLGQEEKRKTEKEWTNVVGIKTYYEERTGELLLSDGTRISLDNVLWAVFEGPAPLTVTDFGLHPDLKYDFVFWKEEAIAKYDATAGTVKIIKC